MQAFWCNFFVSQKQQNNKQEFFPFPQRSDISQKVKAMLHLLPSLVYLQEEMPSTIQNVTTCWDDVTEMFLPHQMLISRAINHNLLREIMVW